MTIKTVGLKKHYEIKNNTALFASDTVYAVNGVDLTIADNETYGLVGESGSGKSTLGRLILMLLEPTSGKIYKDGLDLGTLKKRDLRRIRKDMQIVFQDPYSALDHRMTIENILREPLLIHDITSPLDFRKEAKRLLEMVGLSERDMKKYPREFSEGQRQRISIARALATKPKFIVCDEPVSSLDVSIQSQILNLFMDIKREYSLSYLFISHDLGMIRHVSDRIAVMYLGRIVEKGLCEDVFTHPAHPYTKALISASLIPGPGCVQNRIETSGGIPGSMDLPKGCGFYDRCQIRTNVCRYKAPVEYMLDKDHTVSCHNHTAGGDI